MKLGLPNPPLIFPIRLELRLQGALCALLAGPVRCLRACPCYAWPGHPMTTECGPGYWRAAVMAIFQGVKSAEKLDLRRRYRPRHAACRPGQARPNTVCTAFPPLSLFRCFFDPGCVVHTTLFCEKPHHPFDCRSFSGGVLSSHFLFVFTLACFFPFLWCSLIKKLELGLLSRLENLTGRGKQARHQLWTLHPASPV